MDRITQQYQLWLERADADQDIREELKDMADKPDKMEDAFYRDLAFGTGGLRGIIGAGTNRMNVYTVAKASQGLADYIRKTKGQEAADREPGSGEMGAGGRPRIAVSYDSRIKSRLFAETACRVFAASGLEVFLCRELMPTPFLSFAVREQGCAAGVMVTASHNPAVYNGYKVYGADGCQITSQAAKEILAEIEKLDIFSDIRMTSGLESVRYISDEIYTLYINAVKSQSLWDGGRAKKDLSLVYSPLNGTGLGPVLRTLTECGYENITVVEEQREPDGSFPTCPYPNPEVREAMELGIRYAQRGKADLVLATDPDCDRVGIGVRERGGDYRLLSANETGVLLLDYICSRRIAEDRMPVDPVFMKTIVTTAMAETVASHYHVATVNVLTGFKFIGEQLGTLESQGRSDSFIFAFEESYGYLSGSYVRDKDGVVASLLICEMAAFYKQQGISLADKLEELYETYGYCLDTQYCYDFQGLRGAKRMEEIMGTLRGGIKDLGGRKVTGFADYKDGLDGLPRSNVVRFILEDGCSVVVRPSGTEPKIKVYVSVRGESREAAAEAEETIGQAVAVYCSSCL